MGDLESGAHLTSGRRDAKTVRVYLAHDLFATDFPSAFRSRDHARYHQSRHKVTEPVSVTCVLSPLKDVAQELVSPCEEAPASGDSLRIKPRLVELEEGFERCLGLRDLLVENGVDRLEEELA